MSSVNRKCMRICETFEDNILQIVKLIVNHVE